MTETVAAEPFIQWLKSRLIYHQAEETSRSGEAVAGEIGWGANASGERRLRRYLTMDDDRQIRRATVEDALHHCGMGIWQLYDNVEQPVIAATEIWCPNCAETVTPAPDRCCPWCDTKLDLTVHVLAEKKYRPQNYQHQRRGRRKTASLPETIGPPESLSSLKPAPDAKQKSNGIDAMLLREAAAIYLEQGLAQAGILISSRSGKKDGKSALLRAFHSQQWTDDLYNSDQLSSLEKARIAAAIKNSVGMRYSGAIKADIIWQAAWHYYYDGYGFLRTARAISYKLPGRSDKSIATSLNDIWGINGWPARDRIQATRIASWKHGLKTRASGDLQYRRWARTNNQPPRPRCAHLKGEQRCRNYASRQSKYCYGHSNRSQTSRKKAAAQAQVSRQSSLLPAGPLKGWLQASVKQAGSALRLSELTGISADGIRRYLNGSRKTVKRSTVERYLQAGREAGLTTPSLSQLYLTSDRRNM